MKKKDKSTNLSDNHNGQLYTTLGPGSMGPRPDGPLVPSNPGMKAHGPVIAPPFLEKLPDKEIEKRLKKVEKEANTTTALVERVGDQYQYTQTYIYVAYAHALANLSAGKITNQSDATTFQYSPYDAAGTLLTYRGYFLSKSIYASGDPTDYTWESTSGDVGFTSSERQFTTSKGLETSLGNPTKPGSGVTWTAINPGTAVPTSAVWLAIRHTINDITSNWVIMPYGTYVDTTIIADDAVTGAKISSSTTITAGTGNNVGVLDGADSTYRIYAGHATPASAPFRVKQDGTVIIESAASGSRLVLEDDTIKVFDGTTLRVKLGNLA